MVTTSVLVNYLFRGIQAICGYYIPGSSKILWWAVGLTSLLFGNLYLQFLYTSYFFIDVYIASAIEGIMINEYSYICPIGKCYCFESHGLSSFFFTLLGHVMIFGPWPPPIYQTFICSISLIVYTIVLITNNTCSLSGALFAMAIGGLSGVFKVQIYRVAVYPLCKQLMKEQN